MSEDGLTVTTADHITKITLDRPSRRNALDTGLRRGLTEALRAFDADPAARVAVGIRMARQMSFTGAPVDAATALRAGLVNEVVPLHLLLPRAREIAAQIAARDPALVAAHRAALWRAVNLPADEALAVERREATRHAAAAASRPGDPR